MKTTDFSYTLPPHLIADQPPKKRGASRLLVLDKLSGALTDQQYSDIPTYIAAGDVVVLNDTKVIPARLQTHKKSNQAVRELILVEKHGASDNWHVHKVLYRKRLSIDDILIATDGSQLKVTEIIGDGIALISSPVDLLELAMRTGSVPLPPYMHRAATEADRERYQTVWATQAGSVAAPTASLNMTEETLAAIRQRGAHIVYATLHVGLGTFLPIRVENIDEHVMHKEYFEIPAATIAAIQVAKANQKRIVAIGTTITRTLEFAAELILNEPPQQLTGEADIFMYPGYSFKIVDSLLTNFHAPDSTVLMLAAAFAGWDKLLQAYEHAIQQNYAFLSYGDSMFIAAGVVES
jgi:S-adenosylmethionine:tRNA ribosyltransferase-isomerase